MAGAQRIAAAIAQDATPARLFAPSLVLTLDPSQQREAWTAAVESAGGSQPTARQVAGATPQDSRHRLFLAGEGDTGGSGPALPEESSGRG